MKKFKCKIGWHSYEDKEMSITKNVAFGFSGCELPGRRLRRVCKFCGRTDYINLNLMMPSKYLYREKLWQK